jgi:hypothetical protein
MSEYSVYCFDKPMRSGRIGKDCEDEPLKQVSNTIISVHGEEKGWLLEKCGLKTIPFGYDVVAEITQLASSLPSAS